MNPVPLMTPTMKRLLKRNSVTDYNHSVGFEESRIKDEMLVVFEVLGIENIFLYEIPSR